MSKSTNNIAISLTNVSKTFKIDVKDFRNKNVLQTFLLFFKKRPKHSLKALSGINLEIKKGETLGIIGRNGSGKSTLVKIMSGVYFPDSNGEVIKNGRSILMSLKVGMNNELTARQNIYVNGSALGLKIKEIDNVFDDIIEFAELEEFVDSTTKNFSNGMVAKLSFSIAINSKAEIMFLDEVFAVGDQSFKKKAIKAIENNWLDGRTVVIVSHSMGLIKQYCDRVLYLKDGKIEYLGEPEKAISLYDQTID